MATKVICWNRECESNWVNKKGDVFLRWPVNAAPDGSCSLCGAQRVELALQKR